MCIHIVMLDVEVYIHIHTYKTTYTNIFINIRLDMLTNYLKRTAANTLEI